MGNIEYKFTNGLQPRGLIEKQPYREAETGLIIFTGRQGSGKTTAMFEYVRKFRSRYGDDLRLYSNMPCGYSDAIRIEAKKIYDVDFDPTMQNLCIIDEISSIFSALTGETLEKSQYQAFCQLRKRGVLIVSTAQRFDRVKTAIREQADLIIDCSRTLFGRLETCRVYNLEGMKDIENPTSHYFYMFFPTKKTYDLFDSQHIIKEK